MIFDPRREAVDPSLAAYRRELASIIFRHTHCRVCGRQVQLGEPLDPCGRCFGEPEAEERLVEVAGR